MKKEDFSELIKKDYEEKNLNNFNVRPEIKNKTLEELQKLAQQDRSNFEIMLLNITGDINSGMLIRLGHLLGAKNIIILGRRKIDERTTVGAEHYQNVEKYDALNPDLTINKDEFFKILDKNKSYFPVFIEIGGKNLKEIKWKNEIPKNSTPIFIFGNENRGVSEEILEEARNRNLGIVVSIPQKGVLKSLNVSTAASIVLWDYVKEMDLI